MRIIGLAQSQPAQGRENRMEITCYRDSELFREPRQLPAEVYNTAMVLLQHSSDGVVFVPVRSMQYLAIIDHEEIVFLGSENKNRVEISWQRFRPQRRDALTDPVPYDAVYYASGAAKTMQRLPGEFPPALQALAAKDAPATAARIIKFDRGRSAG